jgi:hypothetical protein
MEFDVNTLVIGNISMRCIRRERFKNMKKHKMIMLLHSSLTQIDRWFFYLIYHVCLAQAVAVLDEVRRRFECTFFLLVGIFHCFLKKIKCLTYCSNIFFGSGGK